MKRSPKPEPTYFRLCHRCSHLNESDVEVWRCERCQRILAAHPPRMRDWEPEPRRGVWDDDVFDDLDDSPRRPPPLAGLSAIF